MNLLVKCDFPDCKEKIEYLPFKCKYCGGTFCKKHRLPENHNCSFNLKNPNGKNTFSSEIPSSISEKKQDMYEKYDLEEYDEEDLDEEMLKFIEQQERLHQNRQSHTQNRRNPSNQGFSMSDILSRSNKIVATYWLMGLNLLFFILQFFWPQYIFLNVINFIFNFQIQTLITSMFTPGSIISVIFSLLILYWTGKMIETQFGPKFLLLLYFISGLFAATFGLFLQFIFQYIPIYQNAITMYFTAHNGVTTGIITFICYYIGLEREMRFYLFFIPIRLKAKYIIWFMAGVSLLWGLLGPDITQLASIVAIPAAKMLYKNVRSRTVSRNMRFF